MSKSVKNQVRNNNIITIVVCLLVVIFATLAIFLSNWDWHNESILGSVGGNGNFSGLEGTIPVSSEKADFDDYFEDTVFVGDSITYGIASYGYSDFNHVFAKVGISQSGALYSKCVYTSKTTSYTIEDALKMAKPGKVILTMGINAIGGYKSESFYDNYRKLLTKIKNATPDSEIIIQSILPVTANWAANNGKANCNQYIIYANQKLYEIAKEEDCYFLHTFEDLCDDEGFLLSKYSGDGIHLSRAGYEAMFNHILSRPVKSSGKFTKIGAIRPPVIYNPNSSTVSMPDLNTQSSIAGNESTVAGNESSLSGSDKPISSGLSGVDSSSSKPASSNVSGGNLGGTQTPDEDEDKSPVSTSSKGSEKPSQNTEKPSQNTQKPSQNTQKPSQNTQKPSQTTQNTPDNKTPETI